jgi:hypothetical protein
MALSAPESGNVGVEGQRDAKFHVRREGRHQAADVTEVRDGSGAEA